MPQTNKFICLVIVLALAPVLGHAQSFSSGSTGVDGPLDLITTTCAQDVLGCQIQIPESGVFNFTTVNIPLGKTVSFLPNLRNTPVVILAQGSVTIGGRIEISGGIDWVHRFLNLNFAGPGGFPGGKVGGHNGLGPGGGNITDPKGRWVGPLSLVPIIGGSGGMGSSNSNGGGGGGAITIASSTSIIVTGQISAQGAFSQCCSNGAGGAIRLVANSINVSGSLSADSLNGHPGMIRLEAPAGFLFFNGVASPPPILSTSINTAITADSSTPSLKITSIGGFPLSYTTGRPDAVDLMLPNQLVDPINVVVQAHNIPVGTEVDLNISGPSIGTFAPGTLSGTTEFSSATISVSGLSRAGTTYIIAIADFTLPASMAKVNPKGPNQITRVRIIAKPNADSKLVFLRKDGTEIDLPMVPKAIQRQFGLK